MWILADKSHEMPSFYFLWKKKKKKKRILYATLMLGVLRVKHSKRAFQYEALKQVVKYSLYQNLT